MTRNSRRSGALDEVRWIYDLECDNTPRQASSDRRSLHVPPSFPKLRQTGVTLVPQRQEPPVLLASCSLFSDCLQEAGQLKHIPRFQHRWLEIKPYGIADTTTDFSAIGSDATGTGSDVGFDVKYGVTQGLTADFTYNTDFAQVEVDEQQVNLTRFGLFFPEKREFFLEGQGIFDFGPGRISGPTTFYFRGERYGSVTPVLFFSRRIGLNEGRPVPITAGGRLTGKTGPYSLGLLNVQTGAEPVSGTNPTNFSVVRIKRDVLRRSSVGALFTGRSISIAEDGANRGV